MLKFMSLAILNAKSKIIDFAEMGGVHDDNSDTTQWNNGGVLNRTLNMLEPGDVFVIPNKTFNVMGGIQAFNLSDVTFQLDGTLSFSDNIKDWPTRDGSKVMECIEFNDINNVTFTSSGMGTFEGNGAKWWGIPFIGYLERVENRPRLFKLNNPKDVLFENI